MELLNDTVIANSDVGIQIDENTGGPATAVTGLVIETDTIEGNGLDGNGNYYGGNQAGVYVLQGNGAIQFLDDQVFRNNQEGLLLQDGYQGAGRSTIDGGAYYQQTGLYGGGSGYGIYDETGSLIKNVLVYSNQADGIYSSNNGGYSVSLPGTISGATVFGNGGAGIKAHTALVTGNLVYSNLNPNRNALELDYYSTGTGNTVYGSIQGIYVDQGSEASGNLVYDIRGSAVDYGATNAPGGITGNTIYGSGTGISGEEGYQSGTIPIDGNLIYQNVTAGISLSNGANQSIVNNTIDELTGSGIVIGGNAVSTTIENNIIVTPAGPAIIVAPTAEGSFESDYNLFDVGSASTLAGSTVGTIGVWENVNYTDLATWYYELGLDQHSQVGDPDFVDPAGSNGVEGFGTPSGGAVFYSSAYVANTPTFETPFTVPIQQLNSIGAVPGGAVDLTGAWTAVDYIGNSFTIPTPGTVTTVNGDASQTITTDVTYVFETNGFPTQGTFVYTNPIPVPPIPLQYYSTAANSGASASWTFTGLIPGQTYQINTINEAGGGLGTAQYVVTDSNGTVLTASNINQGGDNIANFVNAGTVTEDVSVTTVDMYKGTLTQDSINTYSGTYIFDPSYNENEIAVFVATGSTATLTMRAEPGSALDADTVVLIPAGVNGGASDNFHLRTGSPAIDAGDPTTPFLQGPSPNGGRVNQGYDGDTAQAQVSPSATSVQVLSPGNLSKYEIGEQLPINFETTGLTTEQPVLLLHAGGTSISTGLQGNWSADQFRTTGQSVSDTQSAATIGTIANVPTALFSTAADLSSTTAGQGLDFQLQVANGTYTLNLYFADPSANATGQRVFNIIANGVTLQANYDIFAAAKAAYGNGNHAVSLSLTVTVTGGQGLALDFVNVSGYYGALVNGIALEQADPAGTASPTATVQMSTDGGATWNTIATNVPVNGYGQGQYVWTVNQTSNGNTALIRVLSGSASGTSQPFLLSNGGTSFYINDNSLAGDQYTTAAGNDANSGKSPDQPLAQPRRPVARLSEYRRGRHDLHRCRHLQPVHQRRTDGGEFRHRGRSSGDHRPHHRQRRDPEPRQYRDRC